MRKTLILAGLLAAAPFTAAAAGNDMSYTWVEGGWTQNRVDAAFGDDIKLNGGYIAGSFAIAPQVNVFGSFSRVTEKWSGTGWSEELTWNTPEIGIGYHMPMSDRVHFTADASYVRYELKDEYRDVDFGDENMKEHSNAWRATLGLRGKPSARTEAWVKAGYEDYFNNGDANFEGSWTGTIGGQVNITPTWGVVGQARFIEDLTQYQLGVRASF